MDRPKLLGKLGLNEDEFKQMLCKFAEFYNSLNHKQKRVMRRSMLTLAECARTFGDDITEQDLLDLCGRDGVPGVGGCTAASGAPLD